MKSFTHKRSRMMILLGAMAVLLLLLAVLQYNWLGQVSERSSERLESSLRAGANQVRLDFNRELLRAYLNFQMDWSPPDPLGGYHLDRLKYWNDTAPYPRLISNVLVADLDEQGRPRLRRLDVKFSRFEPTEWHGEFVSLRDRLQRYADARAKAEPAVGKSIESLAEEIPALLAPFPSTDEKQNGPSLPNSFTVLKLDLDYMQREFIPALVQRHILVGQTDYHVTVASLDNPQRVVYSSGQPFDLPSSDVSTRIFGLDTEDLKEFIKGENAHASGGESTPVRRLRLLKLGESKRVAIGSSVSMTEENGRWQLMIKHQAGSLKAAVSKAHYRNLGVSFGILLLLATSIVMTAVSMKRAERLAHQQINFVAGVTHELRTPLAVICSAGENLADGVVKSPGKVAQYGELIYREGRRLTETVEQVLEFAGAQSGQTRYEFRSIQVADLISEALAECQREVQEKDFTVETEIDPNISPISGDEAALKRAIQNLISNAIKYDGERRWARISAGACKDGPATEVQITVADHGMGISSDDLPHLFEPFYRGQAAVAGQIKGSGVGLSLVKQIVEAHGGRISVKSTPGTGSAFTLHLPLDTKTTKASRPGSGDDNQA